MSGDSLRCVIGGALMGIANLIPGVSGGTMLLAAGIYPRFITAIAELSSLRLRRQNLRILGIVGISALIAILLLAGTVRDLVVEQRPLMYSLFIGLTLGGAPLLWKMAAPRSRAFAWGAFAGLLIMAGLAWLQLSGITSQTDRQGMMMMTLAGVLGACAMILPGISGSYLLLLLGVYVPLLSAIDSFKNALQSGVMQEVIEHGSLLLFVGGGVLIGVAVVSTLIKLALEKKRQPTLGVLFGLLLGAVLGLWPFQKVEEWAAASPDASAAWTETHYFLPPPTELATAFALMGAGFLVTFALSKWSEQN